MKSSSLNVLRHGAIVLFLCLATSSLAPRVIGGAYAQDPAAAIDAANQQVVQLLNQGKYAEARALAAKTLQQALDTIGPRHPLALLAMGNYASALNLLGEYTEALQFLELGLKINKQVYGEKHPRTIVAMSNYAAVLMGQGRPAEALPLFESALAHHTEQYGEKDSQTLTMLNNYAMALRDLGRYADAAPHLERSYKLHCGSSRREAFHDIDRAAQPRAHCRCPGTVT